MEGERGPRAGTPGGPFFDQGKPLPLEKLFQTQTGLPDGLGIFPPDIPVMPGLVNNPRLLLLVRGIAKNEAVLPAVLHQPLLDRGVLLGSVQHLILGVHNVHGQAQLVPGTATSLAALAMASDRLFPRAICFCTRLL